MMREKDLELQNRNYDTALTSAAAAGNIETAKTMLEKNPKLNEIPNKNGVMPIYMAALFAKPKMVTYLYDISNKMAGDFWTHQNRGWVVQKCVDADMFGVALKILNDRPQLILQNGTIGDILLSMAQKPHAFEQKKTNIILAKIKSSKYMLITPISLLVL
ncbi:putative ankyrin repeat-containing domain-containing protein [Helianthus annuus]|nr:putative ankyrin repeat-containing domain-containing protein [Helianthus annuus]